MVGAGSVALVLVNLWRSGLLYEYRIRTRFRAVCRSKGLAHRVRNDKGREQWQYPRAGRLSGSNASFQLTIRPLLGHDLSAWDKAADAFALAFGATVARLQHDGSGLLVLKVGYAKVAAHEFAHVDQVETATPLTWRQQLAKVEIGKGEGGRPFLLPLLGSHISWSPVSRARAKAR